MGQIVQGVACDAMFLEIDGVIKPVRGARDGQPRSRDRIEGFQTFRARNRGVPVMAIGTCQLNQTGSIRTIGVLGSMLRLEICQFLDRSITRCFRLPGAHVLGVTEQESTRILFQVFKRQLGMQFAEIGGSGKLARVGRARLGKVRMATIAVRVSDVEQIPIPAEMFLMAPTAAFLGLHLRFHVAGEVVGYLMA